MTDKDADRGDMSREAIRARMLAHRDSNPPRMGFCQEAVDAPNGTLCGRPPSRLRLLWWRLTNWIPTP